MALFPAKTYTKNEATKWLIPNYWDIIALTLIFSCIVLIAWGAKQMVTPYNLGDPIHITLNPKYLAIYAIRTTIRLFTALFFSLVFTFTVGTIAAKNKHAEHLIIPIIDILQSVPVLSFLSIAVPGCIMLFKNSMFGPECAAIFAVFTAQVWNMTLSFYQSIKSVPEEFKEVAHVFQLSSWQLFWRVEVPFSASNLLWNMMMSMSGSWFFVVACEAFSIAGHDITLPGIGSYISLAIMQANPHAIIYAIICMLIVILLYDQLLFRPLLYWIEKFQDTQEDDKKPPRSWLINLFQRTQFLRSLTTLCTKLIDIWMNLRPANHQKTSISTTKKFHILLIVYYLLLTTCVIAGGIFIVRFLMDNILLHEIKRIIILCMYTGMRVMILVFISSLIWVPIGVWIGLRPTLAVIVQPIIQFVAAFPANLIFPVIALLIITWNLNVEIWTAFLMILGTQWYILFNIIAGASNLPKELKLATANLHVKGLVRWRRFILPGIAPSFITGAITAAGGAWNASIIAETISWGRVKLQATGIGSYLQNNFNAGNLPKMVAGTIMMCLVVLLINRLFWRPLYNVALKRFRVE